MHMALFRVRDGFISAQVSEIFHEALTVPYAFSFCALLNVFIISFFTGVRDGFSRTWCQSGEFVL